MENSNEYVFPPLLREEIARGIQQAKEGKKTTWAEARDELEKRIRDRNNE